MSLEHAFKRLALRPSSVCHECRRSLASSAQRHQQQSATVSFMGSLLDGQRQNNARAQRQPIRTPAPQQVTGTPASKSQGSYEIARSTVLSATSTAREQKRAQELADLNRAFTRQDLERQVTRKWKAGDVYAPHDLSGIEAAKWKKIRRKPKSKFDVLDQLGINPLDHYKNFSIMSEYITPMGRIRHSNDTGLRPVNQRKMAKAIRRAMGMGLMPGVHRHPEIIRQSLAPRNFRH